MSLKDRFTNRPETKDEQPQPEEQKSVEFYDTAGHARNICFVQVDGEAEFLNYSYLVSCKFLPNESMIKLVFTTCSVEIRGQNLRELFKGIFNQTIQSIAVIEERYLSVHEMKIIIKEITIASS